MRVLDGHGHGLDPEVGRERLGVGDAPLAGEARGHEHPDDVLGPERVDRDGGHERRVDAARQADDDDG